MSNKTSDKDVATEEDIKNVKEFIDYAQEVIDDMEYERPVDVTVYQKYLTSMQSILAEREQDKKRIQELEEENKHLSNVSDYETISLECVHLEEQLEIANSIIQELEIKLKCTKDLYDDCCKCLLNSIPTQVVIDKIEEIKKDKDSKYYDKFLCERDIENVIEILQELLETK